MIFFTGIDLFYLQSGTIELKAGTFAITVAGHLHFDINDSTLFINSTDIEDDVFSEDRILIDFGIFNDHLLTIKMGDRFNDKLSQFYRF